MMVWHKGGALPHCLLDFWIMRMTWHPWDDNTLAFGGFSPYNFPFEETLETFLSLFCIMWAILEIDLAILIVEYVVDPKIMDLIVNWTWDSSINKRQVISFS